MVAEPRAVGSRGHCFIMTTVSDSSMDVVRKLADTHLMDEIGILTCTETTLPEGASRASVRFLPLGSVTVMVIWPTVGGWKVVASKPLSCMTLVTSLMMSVLPYWWMMPV